MPLIKPPILDSFFYRPSKAWNICPDHFTEEIELTAADGCRIVCLHIHTALAKPRAAVFLLHGRGGNASRFSFYAKPLVREGFDIFIADWRGYGLSGGKPNHVNVLEDSRLALEYFLYCKQWTSRKKILWGLSLGGQVAIRLAKEYPHSFDALVTEGAVSSFRQAAADFYKIPLGAFVQQPYTASDDIMEIEKLPKLIIHSVEDRKISFKNALSLFAHAKEPKSLLKIKGDHLFGLSRQNVQRYMEEFKKTACIQA